MDASSRLNKSLPLTPAKILQGPALELMDLGDVADLHLAAMTRYRTQYETVLRNRIGPEFYLFGQQILKDQKVYFWASLIIPVISFVAIVLSVIAISIEKLA